MSTVSVILRPPNSRESTNRGIKLGHKPHLSFLMWLFKSRFLKNAYFFLYLNTFLKLKISTIHWHHLVPGSKLNLVSTNTETFFDIFNNFLSYWGHIDKTGIITLCGTIVFDKIDFGFYVVIKKKKQNKRWYLKFSSITFIKIFYTWYKLSKCFVYSHLMVIFNRH